MVSLPNPSPPRNVTVHAHARVFLWSMRQDKRRGSDWPKPLKLLTLTRCDAMRSFSVRRRQVLTEQGAPRLRLRLSIPHSLRCLPKLSVVSTSVEYGATAATAAARHVTLILRFLDRINPLNF